MWETLCPVLTVQGVKGISVVVMEAPALQQTTLSQIVPRQRHSTAQHQESWSDVGDALADLTGPRAIVVCRACGLSTGLSAHS